MKDLIVGGYGLRNLPVGNKSDSGFVNSHSEADCRSYHRHLRKNLIWPVFKVHLSIHPVFLNFVPVGIFESSMIGKAGNFSFCQCHCQTLTNFPTTLRLSDLHIFFSFHLPGATVHNPASTGLVCLLILPVGSKALADKLFQVVHFVCQRVRELHVIEDVLPEARQLEGLVVLP